MQCESDDALSLRAQYPSSHVGFHVIEPTLLNIRVSVLHTVLQYKRSNSLCIVDMYVNLFYKVVGIVAPERGLKSGL